MATIDAAEPVTCPHCRAPASGRFCSQCGKELEAEGSARRVLGDAIGLKAPPWRSMATTAWLAIRTPGELSRRWLAGERWGLMSPIAMMSTVTAITAFAGILLSGLFHHAAPGAGDATNMGAVLKVYPFLHRLYPTQFALAALDPDAFGARMKQMGSWLAMVWPLLFILPGWLALAPWRRLSSHGAVIFACVEAIFLLILSGLYVSLGIGAPALAANGIVSTAFWIGTCAHTAIHVRALTGAGWGYAIARPFLAAIYYVALIYLWLAVIAALTLVATPMMAV